jgi:hypothetical protein
MNCMCGAEDCPACYPSRWRHGVYIGDMTDDELEAFEEEWADRASLVVGKPNASLVMSIDDSINMLTGVLKNKGAMYAPDDEWTACRRAISALQKAKELIVDSLTHNAAGERTLPAGDKP